VTNEGFLEVSKILADPKTTNDPMIGWVAHKQQVSVTSFTDDCGKGKKVFKSLFEHC